MHLQHRSRAARCAMSVSLAAVVLFSFSGVALAGQNSFEVIKSDHHDVSLPLRDIPSVAPMRANHEHPVKHLPAVKDGGQDGAMQKVSGPPAPMAPTSGFDGIGVGNYAVNAAPPDTNGSVGSTQYVQWVNEAFAVFDKATGAMIMAPKLGNAIWSGFGGGCQTNNDGDPIIVWDKVAQRWLATQFSVSTTPYLQCIAVSQTADATGAWYRYSYSFGTGFNDYPKFGVWPDGYYATYNIFTNGATFAGAKLCAYDRAKMLTGAAANTICSQLSTSYGGVLPADVDGATQPAAGTAEYFVNFGTNALNVWRMTVNWTTSTASLTGPTSVPVSSFTRACSGGTCIVQPGTTQKLDSLADRLMYRLAYRKLADGTAHLVVNHSVQVTVSGKTTSGIRWYDLNVTGTTPTVARKGTYAPDVNFRWMGSAAMDKVGNIVIGYSKSSSTVYPSVFYTVVPAGSSTASAETQLLAGTGAQQRSLSRWGDYSSVSVDSDDCTLWFTTEYLKSNGTWNWSTFIAPVKVATCQ